MSAFHLKPLFLFLAIFFIFSYSKAAYLSRPELVDYNFASANVCEKVNLKIKFDHENFSTGNVFTVEISKTGFSAGSIVQMIGSLTQSGNQQNVFLTVTFPVTVLAGTNYRLRIKGTNPLSYSSQENEYPFSVSKFSAYDPNYYPEGNWKGYFYSWTPNTATVITDANTQDIFNANNYLGYITEDTLSFDFNWADNGLAPGTIPDTNRVCGSYKDFYSIRMRRKINFEEGFYIFGGGGDDGFRMSLDGGATWLINLWSDHQYAGQMNNNGCGTFLTAGSRNVLVEYYENKTFSRFRLIIKKTGDPAVFPISISYPTDGSAVCSQSNPFQMIANPPGGFQWSGPGVSASGIFNPQTAGLGFKTITYETGFSAFGSNCVKSTSVTINVIPGFSAAFSGLDTAYCPSTNLVTLIPQTVGGTFFGSGVSGNTFNPSQLSPGFYSIGYGLNAGSGCGEDTIRKTVHIKPLPDAGFSDLPDTVCVGSANLILNPNIPGGTFVGQGVIAQNQQWIPSILLSSNSYQIEYLITKNGCSNRSEQFVYILDKVKPVVTIQNLKNRYCNSDSVFVPASVPAGLYFLNGTPIAEINPGNLQPGTYELKATYNPTSNVGCTDSASAKIQFIVTANPEPDLGQDVEIEDGLGLTLDPKIAGPYTWTSSGTGGQFEPNKILTFKPVSNLTITINATDPTGTCSGTDAINIVVRPKLEIPNLLTRNGDGTNDDWRFKGAYANMKIRIYDRWGKEIYSGINAGELAWNGEASTKSGLYFYIVEHPSDGRKWNGWLKMVD